jgi:nucleoside-specific outer membrane channel protein Tsx
MGFTLATGENFGYPQVMKKNLLLALALTLAACASSNPQMADYKEEKNAPKFGNSREFAEDPKDVMLAARAVLDELTQQSEPQASGAIKGKGETVETGWVYSTAKNRYVEYQFNGKPARKPLRLRRIYSYTVTPNLSGTLVVMKIEEELMNIDFKNGKEKGWESVNPDTAAYDQLSRQLKEKLRSL